MTDDDFKPTRMKLATITGFIEKFIAESTDKSKETRGTYRRALREFTVFFSRDRLFMFRTRDVLRYRDYLSRVKELREISISTYMTALRRFCQYLADTGVIESNPAKLVTGGRRPKSHSRTFLTLQEVDALLNSIETDSVAGLRDRAIIYVMLGCACSELEISHADAGDLKKTGDTWTLYVQGKGKTVKDEPVEVPEAAAVAIELYHKSLDVEITPSWPLFASRSNRTLNRRMSIRGIRESISQRLKSSNVKRGRDLKLTPFSLRHTAGILMAEAGYSVEDVMKRMRIEWRPTAQLYFKQKGALRSEKTPESAALIDIKPQISDIQNSASKADK
ncbi:tyrosine-type recombinase/integrase [Ignavibacteria bacterium]|nr:tyrosine-type recombinase/integrase [Bacteroidota bacterium]MCZ2133477.1 site-specific integrase [Bacteroidota bacterium]